MIDGLKTLRTAVIGTGAAALVAALSACTTAGPAKPVAGAAPENLQTICASAAASKTGTPAANVKPTSSRMIGALYQVVLDAGGKSVSCIIDAQGAVKAI